MRDLGDRHGLWGYLQAAAEASMVGGLADWFAVTALFRHPLGIPIPHTAIIPRKKDQIGAALASFVQQNFLTGPIVGERVGRRAGTAPGRRVARRSWPRRTIADEAGSALSGLANVMRDDELRDAVAQFADIAAARDPAGAAAVPGFSTRCATPVSIRRR